jgi:hypothetical protein
LDALITLPVCQSARIFGQIAFKKMSILRLPERLFDEPPPGRAADLKRMIRRSRKAGNNLKECTMKFVCLVYSEPTDLGPKTDAESEALLDEHLDYDDVLREGDHYILSDALQPVDTATTVRVRGGKTSVTDGPFAETKELLGGFILIEARDMDEAVQLAAGIPSARMGCIEVRPVYDIPESGS